MPEPIKIQLRPGINRETTDYGNTGGWWDCNLARVRTGTWSSMGGWTPFTSEVMLGGQRSLFPWSTLNGARYYGVGTNLKYYVIRGQAPVDVTPIRATTNPMANNPFQTYGAGSTRIKVTDVANGSVVNDFVTFSGASGPISGIPASEFNDEHQIVEIIDDDHYYIEVTTAAAAGAVSGGGAAVVAAYQLNVGLNTAITSPGWGSGPWGSGGWGEGSGTNTNTNQLRLWSQDNYGEDLIFNPRDGGLYYKDMGNVSLRGEDIATMTGASGVPVIARQVMVSDNDRHVMAFSCNPVDSVTQDRLLVRWSASEGYLLWTPDTTNDAGDLRLEGGSEFVRAVETTTEILVFSDITLHSMRFIGPPYTFGQTRIAANVQLIAPNAVATDGAITAWMANGLFQWYDGVVRNMPCSIRTYVFDILNKAQAEKIYAGVNRAYKEFIWHMPVNDSEQNNFYVICNYEDPANLVWYYGSYNDVGRSTWLDAWFEDTPLAGAADGFIYAHETGATDGSQDPPIGLHSWLKSSVFEIGNGQDFMLVSRMIPDVDFSGSSATNPSVNMTFALRDYPGSAFVQGPDDLVTRSVELPIEEYTAKVDKRFRARSVQIGIEAVEPGTAWSLGVTRLYAAPDGQR